MLSSLGQGIFKEQEPNTNEDATLQDEQKENEQGEMRDKLAAVSSQAIQKQKEEQPPPPLNLFKSLSVPALGSSLPSIPKANNGEQSQKQLIEENNQNYSAQANPLAGLFGSLKGLGGQNKEEIKKENAENSLKPEEIERQDQGANKVGSALGGLFSMGGQNKKQDENEKFAERLSRFKYQCQLPIQETQIQVKPPPNPNFVSSSPPKLKSDKPEAVVLQPIQFMGLNYMSKQIMYQTNSSLCLFSITKSKVTAQRTFSDILNEPSGKSELYTIEHIQPLIIKNCWVTVKNKKQLLFFNSHLDKGTDPAADQNGIFDLKVNQKSEEILTLTKDYKQIRIWVYEIADKQPKRMNKGAQSKFSSQFKRFSTFEVILSNRKNIYFNMGLLQFNVISEMDVMVCQSSIVNEISVWNTNEGSLVYNFSMDDCQKIANGHEEFSGSSFTKDLAQKQGQSAQKTQAISTQSIHDRKFNFNAVTVLQEFVIIYSNNFKKLVVWDIVKQEAIMVRHLKSVKGPVIQLYAECAIDIFSGGILLMNEDGTIYEFSIARGRIFTNAYNSAKREQILVPPESSPKLKHVMSQFFVHQQHKKAKELEQLYPHSIQDNDYQIMQNAYKLHFLVIENGCRQLYILRDQSIDIVELFQPAYSVFEYSTGKEQSRQEKIVSIRKEELTYSGERICEFLVMHNNYGEIVFQRLDELRQIDQEQGGCYKPLSNKDIFLKISCGDILPKCQDVASSNSPGKKNSNTARLSTKEFNGDNLSALNQSGLPSIENSPFQSKDNQRKSIKNSSQKPQTKSSASKFKVPSYENFITAKVKFSDVDLDIGIMVFYNEEGMLAIINLFTMARKFLQLGLQGNVNKIKIIEKDNHDNNYYLVKKSTFKNYSLNDYKKVISKKRFFYDDAPHQSDPNYSVIFICENDIIEIRNDAKANTCNFKNKIAFNERVVDAFYNKNKLQMYAICRDGTVREIETESFTIKRFFRLCWQDISCCFLNVREETTLICGHDRGIITSEQIEQSTRKINSLERKFQIHNFHREQIVSLSQPSHLSNQFASLCKERIVCIWLIDNERPLKVMYFDNNLSHILCFSELNISSAVGGALQSLPNIDRVMLTGENRIFEIDSRGAPYYRSYNVDIQYEWECFTFELSRQISNLKKTLQDTKHFEAEKRFDFNKVNVTSLMSLKQEIMRRFQVEKENQLDTLTQDSQEITKISAEENPAAIQLQPKPSQILMSKDQNSFQLSREDFLPILNSFMSNTSLDTLPQRLLDIEYHHFLKRSSLATLTDLERQYLQEYLNIDYQYLKVLRNLTREQIMNSAKIQVDKDKAYLQMQKIKDQNKLISQEINKHIDLGLKRKQDEELILSKTLELKHFNQRRKNYPGVMMGLISMPSSQKSLMSTTLGQGLNYGVPLGDLMYNSLQKNKAMEALKKSKANDTKYKSQEEQQKLRVVGKSQESKDSKEGELSLEQRDEVYLPDGTINTLSENQMEPKVDRVPLQNRKLQKTQSLIPTRSKFDIKLPQITLNDYQRELVHIRDQMRSREMNLLSNQNSFFNFGGGQQQGVPTRKNSSDCHIRSKPMSGMSIHERQISPVNQLQLYIASETNFIKQPPQTQRRTDHFLNPSTHIQNEFSGLNDRQELNGKTLNVKIDGFKTERDPLVSRKDKLDHSPPKNFPMRGSKNLQDKKLSTFSLNPNGEGLADQHLSKMTDSSVTERMHNSISKVSNIITMPNSHLVLLNNQISLESQSQIVQDYYQGMRSNKNIQGKQRFFSNQRLQNEVLKPLVTDQSNQPAMSTQNSQYLQDVQQIQIPKIRFGEGSNFNTSQVKVNFEQNVVSQTADSQIHSNEQSMQNLQSLQALSSAREQLTQQKLIDTQLFRLQYNDKLNHIKAHQHKQAFSQPKTQRMTQNNAGIQPVLVPKTQMADPKQKLSLQGVGAITSRTNQTNLKFGSTQAQSVSNIKPLPFTQRNGVSNQRDSEQKKVEAINRSSQVQMALMNNSSSLTESNSKMLNEGDLETQTLRDQLQISKFDSNQQPIETSLVKFNTTQEQDMKLLGGEPRDQVGVGKDQGIIGSAFGKGNIGRANGLLSVDDSQIPTRQNLQSYDGRMTQRSHDSDLQNYLNELSPQQRQKLPKDKASEQQNGQEQILKPNQKSAKTGISPNKHKKSDILSSQRQNNQMKLNKVMIGAHTEQKGAFTQRQMESSSIEQQNQSSSALTNDQSKTINIVDQNEHNQSHLNKKEKEQVKVQESEHFPLIDNIAYIESFFSFKVDPLDLVSYFDEHNVDTDTISKEELKKVLQDYLQQHELKVQQEKTNQLAQKQAKVQQIREENRQHKEQMELLQQAKIQQAKQLAAQKDKKILEEIYKKYSLEQQRFIEFLEGKQSPSVSPEGRQNKQLRDNKAQKAQIEREKQKQLKTEANKKLIEQYIREQIVEKWLMRKVGKCVEMIDHGMDVKDVLSKVCPEGTFEEQARGSGQMWRHNKVKKMKAANSKTQSNANNGMFGEFLNDTNPNFHQSTFQSEMTADLTMKVGTGLPSYPIKLEARAQAVKSREVTPSRSEKSRERKTNREHRRMAREARVAAGLEEEGAPDTQTEELDEEERAKKESEALLQQQQLLRRQRTASREKQQNSQMVKPQEEKMKRTNTFSTKQVRQKELQKKKSKDGKLVPADPMSKIDQPSQIIYELEHESMMDGASSAGFNQAFIFKDRQGSIQNISSVLGATAKGEDITKGVQEQIEEDEKERFTIQNSQESQRFQQTFESLGSSAERDEKQSTKTQGDFFSGMMLARKLATDDERTSNASNSSFHLKGISSSREHSPRNTFKSIRPRASRAPVADIGSLSLKDRLSRSLKKKVQSQAQRSERGGALQNQQTIMSSLKPGYADSSSNNQDIRTEQGDAPTSLQPILKLNLNETQKGGGNGKQKVTIINSKEGGGGDTSKRKSALSAQGGMKTDSRTDEGGATGTAAEKDSKSPQKKLTIKRITQKRISQAKQEELAKIDLLNKNTAVIDEEKQSEESPRHQIRIELTEDDVPRLKDELFAQISNQLFDLSPTNRIEQIKLAATLEQLGFEKLKEMGITFNGKKDNFAEILKKIQNYMRTMERSNSGVKLNKKTFNDLKNRLMPNTDIGAQDFVNLLKAKSKGGSSKNFFKSNPKKLTSVDRLHILMNHAIQQMSELGIDEPLYTDDQVTGQNSQQDQRSAAVKCEEVLTKIFEKDQDFQYFSGRLKEYRMKFGQQTQFVESAKDVQDSDRRDYATFDRLEAFHKNDELLRNAYDKSRKFEATKGLIRDVPALSGENSNGVQDFNHYYINMDNGSGNGKDEKFSLNSLCDDIYHMFLEVKKKNKRIGLNPHGDKRSFDHRKNSAPPTAEERAPDDSRKSLIEAESTFDSQNLLKKYKINLQEKKRLEEMSEFERTERKYGIMVKNDPDYLNPVLSQKYLERQSLGNYHTARESNHIKELDKMQKQLKSLQMQREGGKQGQLLLPDISNISKFSFQTKQTNKQL